jgi:hypothetical protein
MACDRWKAVAVLMLALASPVCRSAEPLDAARAFADCMLQYGRDRYGKVKSPLFSNSLTREKEPRILPYPLFADPKRESKDMKTPFRRFDFNKVLNYPAGMGDEGPHKVTVYGCDPYEDRELYEMLFDLTRITGDPKYRTAAEEALTWWFSNTQGPAGLFPWGEHLGWDFEYDCPTYFDGPCKYLYAACFHEVKDALPFLDILARIPAREPGARTPLERYALGIWSAHFWDKEHDYYCRHGDYTGEDDRKGSDAGFPAHLAAYMQVWATAYLNSKDAAFKAEVVGVFNKVLDMAIGRTEKYGFFPFTFAPELTGKLKDKKAPDQSLRLAQHARDLSVVLKDALPEISAKLEKLARLHLGEKKEAAVEVKPPKPEAQFLAIKGMQSSRYAQAIRRNVDLYRTYDDTAFLTVARQYADTAAKLFLDDVCPLPKYSSVPLMTPSGEPFPDFYFRGAELMHAFALLGEAAQAQRKN